MFIMTTEQKLWKAILELYTLLRENINEEEKYQKYFEENPPIFYILGLDVVESFEKKSKNKLAFDKERNFRPEPDFIGINKNSKIVRVIDIKTPFVEKITTSRSSDSNRAKFDAETEKYISQVTEYIDSIKENPESRERLKALFREKRFSAYQSIMIYGLSSQNDPRLVADLCSKRVPPIEIIFFDTLLQKLIEQYSHSRVDIQKRSGGCFIFQISLPKTQKNKKAYLFDIGKKKRNRLSAIIYKGKLNLECKDSNGDIHKLSAIIKPNKLHYIKFEFSNDSEGVYMSLSVNDDEQDLRHGKTTLNIDLNLNSLVLGADLKGNNGAEFSIVSKMIFDSTLSLSEKLEVYYNLKKSNTSPPPAMINFSPEQYFIRDNSGNLVQENQKFGPRLALTNPDPQKGN